MLEPAVLPAFAPVADMPLLRRIGVRRRVRRGGSGFSDCWIRLRIRGHIRSRGRLPAAAARLEAWPPPLGSARPPDFDERRFLRGNAAAINGGGPADRFRDRLRLAARFRGGGFDTGF